MTEGDGGLALQAFVLGLQGFDVGFEDAQTRPASGESGEGPGVRGSIG
jgi:hypothetical protein